MTCRRFGNKMKIKININKTTKEVDRDEIPDRVPPYKGRVPERAG